MKLTFNIKVITKQFILAYVKKNRFLNFTEA